MSEGNNQAGEHVGKRGEQATIQINSMYLYGILQGK